MKTFLPIILLFLLLLTGCTKHDMCAVTGNIIPVVDSLVTDGVPEGSKYNVILILYDDVGYEIPSYTGGQSYRTPNLDMLAAHGIQFTQCHTSPLCSPTRYMLLSGQYNFRNYKQWGVMNPSEYTIANLMHDAGYKTCIAGKWQMDGGASSITRLGFDEFLVNEAYTDLNEDSVYNTALYKNPLIYGKSGFWPDSLTDGKYSQDIFRDFLFDFIHTNKAQPFFLYWALNLAHKPFSPPPGHPDYDTWSNHEDNPENVKYFPSMVSYMDKLTGQMIQKLKDEGLSENTIVLIMADNGTPKEVTSQWKGVTVAGGKSTPTEAGTHVPMLAYCPGTIAANAVDTGLISMVDIMPTMASLAHKTIPAGAGTMDGISFAPRLFGKKVNYRNWIYCSYLPFPGAGYGFRSSQWIQNSRYRRFLDNYVWSFYNITETPFTDKDLGCVNMTEDEKKLNASFGLTVDAIK